MPRYDDDDDRGLRGRRGDEDDNRARRRSRDDDDDDGRGPAREASGFPPRQRPPRRSSSAFKLAQGRAATVRSVGQRPWYPYFAHAVPPEAVPDSPLLSSDAERRRDVLIPCLGSPPPDKWGECLDDKGLMIPLPEGIKTCADFILPDGSSLHSHGEPEPRLMMILFVHTFEDGDYVEELQDLRVGRWRSGSVEKGMIGQLNRVEELMEDLGLQRHEDILMTISRSSEGFGSYAIRPRRGDREAVSRLRRDHPQWVLTRAHLDHIDERLPEVWERSNPYLSIEEAEVLCGMRERERDGDREDRRRPMLRSGGARALPSSAQGQRADAGTDDEEPQRRSRQEAPANDDDRRRTRRRDDDDDDDEAAEPRSRRSSRADDREDDEAPRRRRPVDDDETDDLPVRDGGSARRLDEGDRTEVEPKDYDREYGPLADDVRRRDERDRRRSGRDEGPADLEED